MIVPGILHNIRTKDSAVYSTHQKGNTTGRKAGKDHIMKNIEANKIAEALRSAL